MPRSLMLGAETESPTLEFDRVNASGGIGATRSVSSSTTQARSGTRSFRVFDSGGGTVGAYQLEKDISNSSILTVRFSIFPVTLQLFQEFFQLTNTTVESTTAVGLRRGGGDVIQITRWITGAQAASTDTLPLVMNQWNDFVFQFIINSTVNEVDTARLWPSDGGPYIQLTGDMFSGGTGSITRVRFGKTALDNSAAAMNIYVDDIINAGEALSETPPIRHMSKLAYLAPNAAGDFTPTPWAVVGGGTPQGNLSDTSDTTGIRASGTSAQTTQLALTDPLLNGNPTIPAVAYTIRTGDTLDTGPVAVAYLRANSVSSGTQTMTGSVAPTNFNVLYPNAPGGGAWTPAVLDVLQIGLNKPASGTATDQRTVWKAWVYAEYIHSFSLSQSNPTSASIVSGVKVREVGEGVSSAVSSSISSRTVVDRSVSEILGPAAVEIKDRMSIATSESESRSIEPGSRFALSDSGSEQAVLVSIIKPSLALSGSIVEEVVSRIGDINLNDALSSQSVTSLLAKIENGDTILVGAVLSDQVVRMALVESSVISEVFEPIQVRPMIEENHGVSEVIVNEMFVLPTGATPPDIIMIDGGKIGVRTGGKNYISI